MLRREALTSSYAPILIQFGKNCLCGYRRRHYANGDDVEAGVVCSDIGITAASALADAPLISALVHVADSSISVLRCPTRSTARWHAPTPMLEVHGVLKRRILVADDSVVAPTVCCDHALWGVLGAFGEL